jgi:hypothetical protein
MFPKLSAKVKKILSAYWIYVGQPMTTLPFTIYAFLMGDYMSGGSYVARGFSHEMAVADVRALPADGRADGVRAERRQDPREKWTRLRRAHGTRRGDSLPVRGVGAVSEHGLWKDDRAEVRSAAGSVPLCQRDADVGVLFLGCHAAGTHRRRS